MSTSHTQPIIQIQVNSPKFSTLAPPFAFLKFPHGYLLINFCFAMPIAKPPYVSPIQPGPGVRRRYVVVVDV